MMQRPRIAYFSPLPPVRSGIADYSRELLPYLADYVDFTLFSAAPHEVDSDLVKQFPIHPLEQYPQKRWQYDIPLYQMGNNAHHEAMYQMFLRYPGLVTLHDYSLYHFIAHRTAGQGRMGGYVREFGYEMGRPGVEQFRQALIGGEMQLFRHIPLNKRLLDLSLGLIVHSRYVQNLILARKGDTAVTTIPHQMTLLTGKSRRRQLPWPDDAVIFASMGQITAAKQIELALRAFKKVCQTNPSAYYLIVGEAMPDANLPDIIQSLNLADHVQYIGYVSDKQEFMDWIYTADIIVNLRYPTIGETSGTALRTLALGRALILFDHGWYSEVPDSACIKIPPLDENALIMAMSQLAQNPSKRRQLGEAGRQHIKHHHHPNDAARAYAAFIRQQLAHV